jgi:acetyl esterase/lipase
VKLRLMTFLTVTALLVASCSSGAHPAQHAPTTGAAYRVTTQLLKQPTTRLMKVWAPAGKGHWPVVYAVPGIGGSFNDFNRVGAALARKGVVVIATDYRASGTEQQWTADLVCGYRNAREVAGTLGGDLTQPVTIVGYSRGAYLAFGALQLQLYGPHGSYRHCFTGTPLPDVIVAVDGCYYQYQSARFPFPVRLFTERRVGIVLESGGNDDVCQPWQTERAAHALKAAGFRTTVVHVPDANHYQVMFHDVVNRALVNSRFTRAGQTTVRTVLNAIHAAR